MAITVHGTTKPAKVSQQKIKELKKLYGQMQGLFLAALDKGIRIGELLTEIKEELPHGQFQAWAKAAELPFSGSSARLYMQLYRRREEMRAAGISGIKEAQIFLSSGGNIDEPKRQSAGILELPTTTIEAASGVIAADELAGIKLTRRESELVQAIVQAGGSRTATEHGIRVQKYRAKLERDRKAEERRQRAAQKPKNLQAVEIPKATYQRFQRYARATGRTVAEVMDEAAATLRKK